MQDWLVLVPALPLLSALILSVFGGAFSSRLVMLLGVGSMAGAAGLTALISVAFVQSGASPFTQFVYQWMPLVDHPIYVALYFDSLAMVMTGVITGVGLLIHWYAAAYMSEDKDIRRFFVYMNLFVFAMLMLVLGNNLVLLFLGWEGVGLCSFLLIGFWYDKTANARAARKAFIVTRVGDMAMIIGLLILFAHADSLNINDINQQASTLPDHYLWLACLCLIGGAVGKSAQLPLQTWLPDAMAGPTPVSALIHAATMVTAGVYLIARMHPLFLASENALTVVSWIGAVTLLVAGFAALAQTDIKRILAYSTMSQIGYMFVGLGAGAFGSAVFHLMTHAFFKALLFLTAGSIIVKLHHEQDIRKMGGLYKSLPLTASFLLIGLLALVAVPGTSGFFSKEAIIAATYHAPTSGVTIWALAVLGTFLTSLYSFRLLFVVCFGPQNHSHSLSEFSWRSHFVIPLLPLAVLSVIGGWVSPDLSDVLPQPTHSVLHGVMMWVPVIAALAGAVLAWFWFFPGRADNTQQQSATSTFFFHGLGFDWLYRHTFLLPLRWFSRVNHRDITDNAYHYIARRALQINQVLVLTQNGHTRWYLMATFLGLGLMFGGILLWG